MWVVDDVVEEEVEIGATPIPNPIKLAIKLPIV